MQKTSRAPHQEGTRGDYFTDRLGGITAIILALVSLGIVISRFDGAPKQQDLMLAALYVLEIVAAGLILPSKRGAMNMAFWLMLVRVILGLIFVGVFRDDKLARTTIGFAMVEALYCWVRSRALLHRP